MNQSSVPPRLRGLVGCLANQYNRRLRLWAPVVLYMAAIFYVSSLSQPPVPAGTDKPWHSVAYFGLAVVVARAVAGGLPRRIHLRPAVSAIAIAAAYAVSDEVHQMFVPGRFADVKDLLADVTGVLTGTSACWAWGAISHKHKAQEGSTDCDL